MKKYLVAIMMLVSATAHASDVPQALAPKFEWKTSMEVVATGAKVEQVVDDNGRTLGGRMYTNAPEWYCRYSPVRVGGDSETVSVSCYLVLAGRPSMYGMTTRATCSKDAPRAQAELIVESSMAPQTLRMTCWKK
jgi:hypothetical protein